MKLLQVPIVTTIDFDALANVSHWNQLCWESAWNTLIGYEKPIDNLDEVWAFVVRIVFKSRIPPTDVADMVLEIFDQR